MKRFAGAFAGEWQGAGRERPHGAAFRHCRRGMTAMRRELQRRPPAAILLAMDGASATLAKPYLGSVPCVRERTNLRARDDRDRARSQRAHRDEDPLDRHAQCDAVRALPRREMGSAALTRPVRPGLDAFALRRRSRTARPDRFSLDGATGQIALDGRNFTRESRFAVFRDGNLLPVEGPR
jgi:hypothetical protein